MSDGWDDESRSKSDQDSRGETPDNVILFMEINFNWSKENGSFANPMALAVLPVPGLPARRMARPHTNMDKNDEIEEVN